MSKQAGQPKTEAKQSSVDLGVARQTIKKSGGSTLHDADNENLGQALDLVLQPARLVRAVAVADARQAFTTDFGLLHESDLPGVIRGFGAEA